MLSHIGNTTDNKKVIGGTYKFFETNGLPLDIIFEEIKNRGSVPCWTSFYEEAISAGMKHDRIFSKLEEAIADVWGSAYSKTILSKLNDYLYKVK